MAKIIGIVNQKGGVAKTTTANALTFGLAQQGYNVLAIDLDPQSNLTSSFLNDKNFTFEQGALEFLNIQKENIYPVLHIYENIDFIPSTIRLEVANSMLTAQLSREKYLKKAIDKIRNQYDYIIIDSSPTLSLLTINVLVASDELIIPTKAEFHSLQGIDLLISTITAVRELNNNLKINGFLITMYDARRKTTDYTLEYIDEIAKENNSGIYKTKIRNNVKVAELPHGSKNIFETIKNSDYEKFIKEFLVKEEV